MEVALLEPAALDRRWFDTSTLLRSIERLASLRRAPGDAAVLSQAGAHIGEQGNRFTALLSAGQLDQAGALVRQLEAGREALLTQLDTALANA
jgi:methyl-accepting chemotaxis protein